MMWERIQQKENSFHKNMNKSQHFLACDLPLSKACHALIFD